MIFFGGERETGLRIDYDHYVDAVNIVFGMKDASNQSALSEVLKRGEESSERLFGKDLGEMVIMKPEMLFSVERRLGIKEKID